MRLTDELSHLEDGNKLDSGTVSCCYASVNQFRGIGMGEFADLLAHDASARPGAEPNTKILELHPGISTTTERGTRTMAVNQSAQWLSRAASELPRESRHERVNSKLIRQMRAYGLKKPATVTWR